MKKLTEKQDQYARNRAAGVKQKEAAIAAGFSALTADKQASALERRDDIKKAIARYKKEMRSNGMNPTGVVVDEVADEDSKKRQMPRAKYDDPIQFLEDLMNHKHMPVAMRADAAKQLLPYKHARIGEKGKKESAKDRAKEIASGGKGDGKPKFATKRPPPLKVVNGGKS